MIKWIKFILVAAVLLLVFYLGRKPQPVKNQSNPPSETKTEDIVYGTRTEFVREGDDWVLYDYDKQKLGLTVPVQMAAYYDEPSPNHTKYLAIPKLEYEISPDQTKVVYLAKEDPEELGQEYLYLANVNGSNKEILARPEWNYAHGAIGKFFWSVDGKYVIYLDTKGDEGGSAYDLYKINVETKAKKKLDSGSTY